MSLIYWTSTQGLPLSAIVPTLTPLGFSPDVARLFEEMTGGINSGHVAYEGKGIEFRRGTVTAKEAVAKMLGHEVA